MRPRMSDVYFRSEMLRDPRVEALEPYALWCLMRLAKHTATRRAWTYSPPDPGGWLPDAAACARLCDATRGRWGNKIRPALSEIIEVVDGRERLPVEWLVVGIVHPRFPVSDATRRRILERDNYSCVYCGGCDELEVDHRLPVSKGGTNDDENPCAACRSCNRDKRALTEEEWRG